MNRKRLKPDEVKPQDDKNGLKELPKMKKLTWQSSITNGNKTESSITGSRVHVIFYKNIYVVY